MPYSTLLADRIRLMLSDRDDVEEKKMFRGITFMVDGKMCISVSGENIMCRINPDEYEDLLKKPGARPVIMRGRETKGYIYVSPQYLENDTDLQRWVDICLAYNPLAQASKK